MNIADHTQHDATGLADLVRGGEVSAAELHQVAAEAVAAVDPQLNAVADGPWDQPLEHSPEGPFAGVPFALKDLGCHAAGIPIRIGTRISGNGVRATEESFLIRRFREAGLAITALTTTPELGFNTSTEALVYGGPTRNPWDASRSAGGSSGGAAALVAAGGIPIAHASDGGGSIRIPAAFNGLVGLKPSRGRTSYAPDFQEVLEGISTEFVVARSMRDCATALDAAAGSAPGDKYIVAPPLRPWSEELTASPRPLRVALQTESWSGSPVDPEVVAAVEAVGRELQELGHEVERAAPRFDWDEFIVAQAVVFSAWNADVVNELARETGIAPGPDSLEATTLSCYERGRELTVFELGDARRAVNRIVRAVGAFFTDWDLHVTPTVNVPPFPLGHLNADDAALDVDAWVWRLFDVCSFTPVFNWTGTPAISLPLGQSSAGLPIGVQLAAPMCEEATLIGVGAQLERAMPWAQRRPGIHAAVPARSAAGANGGGPS